MHINVNNNDHHQQKTMCTFLYIQKLKKTETFLYAKTQTLSKKPDNWRCVFTFKEPDTLRYAFFYEILEIGIHIQKA